MIKIKKSQNKKTLESDMIHLITLNIIAQEHFIK